MIRAYQDGDIDQVLELWLSASIKAHDFVEPAFWESQVSAMRDSYIPASDTFVYDADGQICGFYCLHDKTLAAIFVSPKLQGRGLGSALLDDAKGRRESLILTVYKKNRSSVRFYEKHGFTTLDEQVDKNTGQAELLMEYHS